MGIVYDDIRISLCISNDPESSRTVPADLLIEHWTMQIAMPQETKPEERKSHPFRKEDPSYTGRDFGECEPDTANDQILEKRGVLTKR